jgi:hypothetical protein
LFPERRIRIPSAKSANLVKNAPHANLRTKNFRSRGFNAPVDYVIQAANDYSSFNLKVLISAIACSPSSGSEGAAGWNWVIALSSRHELWVLTHKGNEADIVAAMKQGKVPANVKFQFVGEKKRHHPNRLIARFQDWYWYIEWTRQALPVAKELSAKIDFDLVHHISYSTWRVACPLQSLGLPLFGDR